MKKKKIKKQNKKNLAAKLSYISVGLAATCLVVGVVSALRIFEYTENAVHQTPMPIPSAAPVFAQTPAPERVKPTAPVATKAPVETAIPEPDVTAVFKKKEPFVIRFPLEGDILQAFSMDKLLYSKSMGDWRVHNGIDIACNTGTEVKAAASGTVEKLFKDALLGYTVVLSHEGEYETWYQNLASTEMLSVGQKVEQGACIGAVGDSAPSEMLEEAHMHFAVKEGETFVNPLDFIEKSPS